MSSAGELKIHSKSEMIRLAVLSSVILVLILEVNAWGNGGEDLYKAFKDRYDTCRLPLRPGNCSLGVGQWHYNHAVQKCEKFIYYSCWGNANRFTSKSECIDICIHYRNLLIRA